MTKQTEVQANLENVLDKSIKDSQAKLNAIDDKNADSVLHSKEDVEKTVLGFIELLDTSKKLTVKDLAEKLNEVITEVNNLQSSYGASGDTVRDIKSDRSMTEEDARRVLLGDLKDVSTKEAALELGLSYGQIYSCRKGFTFKKVYKEFREQAAEK